jgi:hypothetical protein
MSMVERTVVKEKVSKERKKEGGRKEVGSKGIRRRRDIGVFLFLLTPLSFLLLMPCYSLPFSPRLASEIGAVKGVILGLLVSLLVLWEAPSLHRPGWA